MSRGPYWCKQDAMPSWDDGGVQVWATANVWIDVYSLRYTTGQAEIPGLCCCLGPRRVFVSLAIARDTHTDLRGLCCHLRPWWWPGPCSHWWPSESVLSRHLWPVLQSDSMLIPWAMLSLKGTYHHACLSPRAMVNGCIQAHAAAKGKVCILVFLKSGLCYLWLVLPLEVTWTTIVCCGLCYYWGPSWPQWPVLLCKAMVMPYHGAAAESHVWICSWVYADICGQKAGRMSVV